MELLFRVKIPLFKYFKSLSNFLNKNTYSDNQAFKKK